MKRGILYTFVYILITIVSTIGTIAINALLPGNSSLGGFSNSSSSGVVEVAAGEKVLNSMMTMGTTEVNLELELYENSINARTITSTQDGIEEIVDAIKINFVGNINIVELENIKMSGLASIILDGNTINLEIAFYNNVLYVSNETLNVKMEAVSLSKIMEILPLFGIDMDINIDMSSIDINSLMANFADMPETTLENGDKALTLTLMEGVAVDFITDANYNVKGVVADRLQLAGYIINMSTSLDAVEGEIANPEESTVEEYVDVTKTLNIVDSISEIMTNEKLHLDIEAHLGEGADAVSMVGDIDVDYSNELAVYVDLILDIQGTTNSLKLGYIDQNIYVTLNNINLIFYAETIDETIDIVIEHMNLSAIEEFILKHYIKTLPESGLDSMPDIDLSNVNIDNLLDVAKGEDNVVYITVFGNAMGMDSDIKMSISLDENDQFEEFVLYDVNVLDTTLDATISYSSSVNIPDLDEDTYYDMAYLPKFVDVMMDTVDMVSQSKRIGLVVDDTIKIQGIPVTLYGELNVDFASDVRVYLNIDATVFNKTFYIDMQYIDGYVYLSADNIKLSFHVSDIADVSDVIANYFDSTMADFAMEIVENTINTSDVLIDLMNGNSAIPTNMINSISMEEDNISIGILGELFGLDNDVILTLGYNDVVDSIGISIPDMPLDITLDMVDNIVVPDVVESEYSSLTYLDNLVNAGLNTYDNVLANGVVALNASITVDYAGYSLPIDGIVAYGNDVTYVNLSTKYMDRLVEIQCYIVEEIVYLNIDGLQVKTTIDGIENVIALFDGNIEATILGATIIPIAVEEIDLSGLDLNILENISIGEYQTTITLGAEYIGLDNDLELVLNYTDTIDSISVPSISVGGVEAGIYMTIASGYTIPTLYPNDYSDISYVSHLVSAVTNTIDYLKLNKKLAVTLNANIMDNMSIRGTVYVDLSLADMDNIDIRDVSMYALLDIIVDSTYTIELRLDGGYAYVSFKDLHLKMEVNGVSDMVDLVQELLPSDTTNNMLEDMIESMDISILKEVLNGNYSNVSLSLINKIIMSSNATYITLDKSIMGLDKDFRVSVLYNDKINSLGLLNVVENGVSISVNMGLNYVFTPSPLQKDKYFDISGISYLVDSTINTIDSIDNEKAITLNLNKVLVSIENTLVELSGTIYVDFSSSIVVGENGEDTFDYTKLFVYMDIDAKIDNNSYIHNITLYLENGNLYITYNTFSISIDIDEIDNLTSLIARFQELNNKVNTTNPVLVQDIDISAVLEEMISNIDFMTDIDMDIDTIDFDIVKYLHIANDNTRLVLDKSTLGLLSDIDITLAYADYINSIVIENICVDNISINVDMGITYGKQKHEIIYANYSNLDYLDNALSSTLDTATDVVDNEHIAFGLSADITYTDITRNAGKVPTKETITNISLLNTSYAKFDWSEAYEVVGDTRNFNLEKMSIYAVFNARVETITYNYVNGVRDDSSMTTSTRLHSIEITYLDNVVYIKFDKMSAYLPGETIGGIIDTIADIMGADVSTDSLSTLMGMISNSMDTSMLEDIKIEMIESLSVTDNMISMILDMTSLDMGIDRLDLDVNYDIDGLTDLVVTDLSISNIDAHSINIKLDKFTPIEAVDTTGYMRLSGIEDLLVAIKNTIQFTDYELAGNVKLQLNILDINFDIPVNFKLKLTDNGPEAKVVMGPIPVITGVNDDAPYIAGNTVDGIYPGKNRVLTIYLKDNMFYIYRSETVPAFAVNDRIYEKRTKVHMDTFMDDPLYYILEYGMGFSSSIMSSINASLNKDRKVPLDYSNILVGFESSGNSNSLTLNLKELAEDEAMDTMTVGIITTSYNGESVIGVITLDIVMPVADGVIITIKSNDLTLVNMGQTIDFTNDLYPYVNTYKNDKEGAEWGAYNGQWTLASQRKFTITYDTRCDQVVDSFEAPAGSRIDLPVLSDYYVDTDTERTYYEFAGWYDTITYDNQFTAVEMPRSSITLYARWITHVEKYITIDFEEMGGDEKSALRVLENSKLNLPTYDSLLVVETTDRIETLQFEYWYQIIDGEEVVFVDEFAPNADIVLYAKWKSVDVAETHAVTIYDNGQFVAVKRFFEGDTISFSGAKFNDTTKYLYNGAEFDMIMLDMDMDIEIRNIYTITVKYKLLNPYRDAVDIVYTGYQGETLHTLPSQTSGYYDDGTQASRETYTFNGWLYNGSTTAFSVIPNSNSTIVADWTKNTLYYYDVSFNVSWVKPGSWQDNNSSLFGKVTKVQDAVVPSAPFRVLEGTTLTMSDYKALCIYQYTGAWVTKTYEFDVAYWSDEKSGQLYYNNGIFENESYTPVPTYEIKDNVVFYAVWKMCKDY